MTNWDCVVGVSFLPYSEHSYKQAPYESITKEQYEALMKDFKQIDYSQLSKYEVADNTSGARTFACVGGGCDI